MLYNSWNNNFWTLNIDCHSLFTCFSGFLSIIMIINLKWARSRRSQLRSSQTCGLSRSALRGLIAAAKGRLRAPFVKLKWWMGHYYSLVALTNTHTVAIVSPQVQKRTWSVPFGTGPTIHVHLSYNSCGLTVAATYVCPLSLRDSRVSKAHP